MKTTLILAAAAAAMAQNLSGIPTCAVPCITSAVSAAGCAATDVACQCGSKQTDITNKASGCVLQSCQASEIPAVLAGGNALCAAYSSTAGSGGASSTAITTATSTGVTRGTLSNSATTVVTTGPTTGTVTSAPLSGNMTFVTPNPSPSGGGSGSSGNGGSGTTGGAGGAGTSRPGSSSTSSPNAAATPAVLGAGALLGVLGLVAAL